MALEKIVMLGDSIIDWNYNSKYINYGHAGFKTRDVLWLLEEKPEIEGDIGILLVGVNDILCGFKEEYTLDYYSKTVDILRKRFKKLVLLSMLPSDTPRINIKSKMLNEKLKELYPENFFDIYNLLLNDKEVLADKYTVDGIHLNNDGYDVFNKALIEIVDKIKKDERGYPDRETAERELEEAGKLNPGQWITHSKYAALACEKIAEHCPHMDSEKAYVIGLLHDIGRRVGIVQERHMLEGYNYCMSKGWKNAAQICITHSFMLKDITTSIGKWDISKEDYEFMKKFIEDVVYDDYDKLAQMCDSLALPDGFCFLEKRFVDVAMRYGVNEYTTKRWGAIYDIKKYFEDIASKSIEEILEIS
ncbi:hypothetical protein M2102_001302 [Fusobacterium sp. PH5-7]|uniref:GDSL-type esterase/lipase family protein n=1 Tax=Fusobacterium sp. PH5-7 TaxID=2940528 RepID=UPI002475EBDE|nr:GDSL-type esterase/lipase family protein [Fusobacterium sp. PH5-7]MDH6457674.1 hypothetical protein [Fusobacterium sp. PH5-7]